MSIKRPKPKSSGSSRKRDDDATPSWGKPAAAPEKTWAEHLSGRADAAFVPYAVTSRFTEGQLLAHSKFGKGVVLLVDGSRIEVLFEDGRKKLGHAQP